MHYRYKTQGTCSQRIDFDMNDDHIISNVTFLGGCNGNLQGIGRLVEGKKAEEIADLLGGVSCGGRPTSCPDQLSQALRLAVQKAAEQ